MSTMLEHIHFMKRNIIYVLLFNVISAETNAQTIAPLPIITKAVFAQQVTPIQFTTASASGNSTFYSALVSISSSGIISGTGSMETCSNAGAKVSTTNVTVLAGSQISSSTTNLVATNVRTLDFGYINGGEKIKCADYFADVTIKLSNGFILRGKCAYLYRYAYKKSGNEDESDSGFKLNVTGPGGHIGFISTGAFN